VTGRSFTREDRLKPIKEYARRAWVAAERFDQTGPLEYSLPLTYREREALKAKFDEGYIVALFASSLMSSGWQCDQHPDYPEFAAGILALPGLGARILETDPSLAGRYPPAELPGMRAGGYYDPKAFSRSNGRKRSLV